jgi:hypothetical protein
VTKPRSSAALTRHARLARLRPWLVGVGGVFLAGSAFMLVLALVAAWLRPALSQPPVQYPPAKVAEAERTRDVSFDGSNPDALPRIQKDVDYGEGKKAAWWPKGESPILTELVQEGKLPPLEERVGPEPVVLDGGSPGNYGGTWLRVATSDGDIFIIE